MLIRTAFGVALVLATALLFTAPAVRALARPEAYPALRVLFVGSRLAGWFVAYVALAEFTRYTDLVLYYYPEAKLAMGGHLPYIDFPTSYGPLFPYVAGLALPFWDGTAAVALVLVLVEIAAVLSFAAAVKRDTHAPGSAAHWLLAIYSLNPAALYWSGMMAYNSSLVLLCWGAASCLLVAGRYTASTVWLGASVVVGKFLGVIIAPLWLAHPARRVAVVGGASAAALAAWLAARGFGADLLLPLLREGSRSTAGNLWFLLGALTPLSTDGALWRYGPAAALATGAAGLTAWMAINWRDTPHLRQFSAGVSALGWLFLLLSKKSYPHYAPMFLLLTVAALCDGRQGTARWALLLAIVGAVGLVEPGLWNALGQPAALSWAVGDRATVTSLVAADTVLVTGALVVGLASARAAVAAIREPGTDARLIRNQP